MTKTQAAFAALGALLTFSVPAFAQDTPPAPLTQTDQQFLIQAAQGASFDRAWLQQAIQTNKQDISDAQKEEAATTDPEVKPLVRAYEATETAHMIAAQSILGMMK